MSSVNEQTDQKTMQIMLLAGGRSAEREVSLLTAKAIQEALIKLGHQVTTVDPGDDLFDQLTSQQPDLVFNALHGTYGEDGVIQGILDWYQLPYTGSGVKSSALAMDKATSRLLFEAVQIPVAQAYIWQIGQTLPTLNQLPRGPWIIKPTNEGSSVGLHRCFEFDEIHQILSQKSVTGPKDWLIESLFEGTELSVVVFDNEVWGAVEIAPSEGLYDYEAKYIRNDTVYYCPPRLEESVLDRLFQYAQKAYQVLDCKGICRVDFITDTKHDIILELNTLPGMTKTSLVPKVAQAKGISFENLIELMIQSALKG